MSIFTKQAHITKLRQQIGLAQNQLSAQEAELLRLESLRSQGINNSGNAKSLQAQLQNSNVADVSGPQMSAGNVGDINKVIWPFYFSTDVRELASGGTVLNTGFNITQEAAFVMLAFSKTVYRVNGASWEYCDPDNNSSAFALAPGVKFSIKDGSSQRVFSNQPVDLAHYGNPRYATKLPRAMMFLPNQSVQVQITNMHTVNNYIPIMTFFGYRIRIEDAQKFLGLVYA